ncbi:MAG: hypothetical protein IKW00_02050 [Clostridia bacterium]|nr:hypothetical protein [Clostridia bacterium]
MIRKWLSLALVLMLAIGSASAAGYDLCLQAEKSDILSEGALRGLSQWLDKARLTLWTEENPQAAVYYGDTLLLAADEQLLTDGKTAVAGEQKTCDIGSLPAKMTEQMRSLAALAAKYEKSAQATAELGNIVKAKKQLSYALTADQWAEIWPKVAEVLGEWVSDLKIESKGTLRRYFASDGSEIGGYFYAEKVRIAENDVRQVRLEYGYDAEKGLYLAFRCPNARETRNIRITMTVKISDRDGKKTRSISADVRRWQDGDQDVILLEGSVKEQKGAVTGKTTLDYTRKRDGKSLKQSLTASHDLKKTADGLTGEVSFDWKYGGRRALSGKVTAGRSERTKISMPAAGGDESSLQRGLTQRLLRTLQNISDEDRLELIYYLNRSAYLTGEEKEIYITYDPEFTVTEEHP